MTDGEILARQLHKAALLARVVDPGFSALLSRAARHLGTQALALKQHDEGAAAPHSEMTLLVRQPDTRLVISGCITSVKVETKEPVDQKVRIESLSAVTT